MRISTYYYRLIDVVYLIYLIGLGIFLANTHDGSYGITFVIGIVFLAIGLFVRAVLGGIILLFTGQRRPEDEPTN